MDLITGVILTVICAGIAVFFQSIWRKIKPLPRPHLNVDQYWGPEEEEKYKENPELIPTKIHYSQEIIDDLRNQLNRTLHLQDPLIGIKFEYGFNSKKLKELINYWRDDYLPRWKDREAFLNRLPHFTTQIQGLDIHYIHVKPDDIVKGKQVYPLLLLHGWPGSVREFYDLIPLLTKPSNNSEYVFEVIAPSLPGFGWSQASSRPGLGQAQAAVIFRNLMLRLGHERFFIQGGDWGSVVGSHLSTLFPQNVFGYHSNFCVNNSPLSLLKLFIANLVPSFFVEKQYQKFFFPAGKKFLTLLKISGYFHIQATTPDTVGAGLTDNPVGLAAYILEKFASWYNFFDNFHILDIDPLFDNLMIYHLTHTITSSFRFYAESMRKDNIRLKMDRVPTSVPTGCARFETDILHATDWQLKDKYTNLIHSTYHFKMGHFPALQAPQVLYKDFVEFVNKVEID